ncbi:hypothetical protein [Aliivibrio fischeri]|uniref:Uncharacterized protein n=1 Tax=Aliivibrio fischeri TaxID=668 RepID=A0A510UN68_ALIFS|nr:hypothetical protein [Aliivibrio fischeri]GEK16088.1 hypothetical protein AFI02nite_41240 [Aliivibrio fischeri]
MSEYFLMRPSSGAIIEVSKKDKSYLPYSDWACVPTKPIRMYETFKPEGDYDVPECAEFPRVGLAKRVVLEAGLQYTYGVNWVPANLTNNKVNRDYFYINCMPEIKCVDLVNSEYSMVRPNGTIRGLEKLALDDSLLSVIPLNHRLIFKMKESARVLFHKSVVERIMATNPINTTFIPCEYFV